MKEKRSPQIKWCVQRGGKREIDVDHVSKEKVSACIDISEEAPCAYMMQVLMMDVADHEDGELQRTFTRGFEAHASNAALIPSIICGPSAFNFFGRFNVIVATPRVGPETSTQGSTTVVGSTSTFGSISPKTLRYPIALLSGERPIYNLSNGGSSAQKHVLANEVFGEEHDHFTNSQPCQQPHQSNSMPPTRPPPRPRPLAW
jgi:hypothetical protein